MAVKMHQTVGAGLINYEWKNFSNACAIERQKFTVSCEMQKVCNVMRNLTRSKKDLI